MIPRTSPEIGIVSNFFLILAGRDVPANVTDNEVGEAEVAEPSNGYVDPQAYAELLRSHYEF